MTDSEIYKEISFIVLKYYEKNSFLTDMEIMEMRSRLSTLTFQFFDQIFPNLSLEKTLAEIELLKLETKEKQLEGRFYEKYVKELVVTGFDVQGDKHKISVSKADDMARKIMYSNEDYYNERMALIESRRPFQLTIDRYWNVDKTLRSAENVMKSMIKRTPWENTIG